MNFWLRCGLMCCLLSGLPVLAAERLTLATETYPPYNMLDDKGQVSGVSTEIVRQLLQSAGIDFSVGLYPWSRAILMARIQPNTCVYSMSRTPEREALYKWVGPLVYNDWVLFAIKQSSHPTLTDALRNSRIGSYKGDAIVDWLTERGFNVDVANSDDLNPRKLMLERIDFWATGKLIGQYWLRRQGLQDRIEPVLTFNRTEMYLACQRDMPDALIADLNQRLQAMYKRGAVRRIYDAYGYKP
ncbi:ABC transporter substrate-binding protein [Paludibacterium sp. B53371]|uniref:substrate-binding periplasmic protein n=1 Tax=Paludibacterium sp. B53371 TaxID=2806263 RepID=UPI001C03E98E|nr:transporter substrate-binding domain-containing protein [Paludibacterium sp. B53371]